jgi:hypothetical protein
MRRSCQRRGESAAGSSQLPLRHAVSFDVEACSYEEAIEIGRSLITTAANTAGLGGPVDPARRNRTRSLESDVLEIIHLPGPARGDGGHAATQRSRWWTSRARSTDASISTLRLVKLSTLMPNGRPRRRQKSMRARALVTHWS